MNENEAGILRVCTSIRSQEIFLIFSLSCCIKVYDKRGRRGRGEKIAECRRRAAAPRASSRRSDRAGTSDL